MVNDEDNRNNFSSLFKGLNNIFNVVEDIIENSKDQINIKGEINNDNIIGKYGFSIKFGTDYDEVDKNKVNDNKVDKNEVDKNEVDNKNEVDDNKVNDNKIDNDNMREADSVNSTSDTKSEEAIIINSKTDFEMKEESCLKKDSLVVYEDIIESEKELQNINFDGIGGLQYIKETITKTIVWPFKYKELYNDFGCKGSTGILFYGLPGTGKTLVAKAIASLSNINFIYIKGPELFLNLIDDSEKSLREIFEKARQAVPCVIFFDEIEYIVPIRGKSDTAERLVCQMLAEMDKLEESKEVLVIGTTTRLDIIDPAFLKQGRFDMTLEFKKPDIKEREEILLIHLKDKPIAEDIDVSLLAGKTEGYTGADIKDLCRKAALEALADYISGLEENEVQQKRHDKDRLIHMEHFQRLLLK